VQLRLPGAASEGVTVTAVVEASPVRPGRPVVLQQLTEDGWTVVAEGAESGSGRARMPAVATPAGDVAFRAVVERWRGAVAASSNRETLEVDAVDTTPPPTPTGLAALSGDTTASLTWEDVLVPDLHGYVVYQAAAAGGPWVPVGSANGTSFQVTGLENGTEYFFAVAAVDTSGNASGRSASVMVVPVEPDVTAPPPPTGLLVVTGDGEVELTWDAVGAADVVGYRVYVRQAPEEEWTPTPAEVIAGTSRSVVGLTNGMEYSFAVAAVDSSGNESVRSMQVTATPLPPSL
jgi:fibronectin type 3 domain-containing protein